MRTDDAQAHGHYSSLDAPPMRVRFMSRSRAMAASMCASAVLLAIVVVRHALPSNKKVPAEVSIEDHYDVDLASIQTSNRLSANRTFLGSPMELPAVNIPSSDIVAYSFRIDASSANFIRPGVQLFDYSGSDTTALPLPASTTHFYYDETMGATSQRMSNDMHIEGSYGAFSAAMSASGSSSSTQSHREMKAIWQIRSTVKQITVNTPDPHTKLKATVRAFMNSASAQQIVDRFGEFYALNMDLGGAFQSIFTQTMTTYDSRSDFTANVQANARAWSAEARGSTTQESSATGSSQTLNVDVTALGGSPTIWLRGGDFGANQRQWLTTFNDNNLFPTRVHLVPIWELVSPFNTGKANQIRSYLTNQWSAATRSLATRDGASSLHPVCSIGCGGAALNGGNWYHSNWRSGNPTSDWTNANCPSCHGSVAQIRDCQQVCITTDACVPGCNGHCGHNWYQSNNQDSYWWNNDCACCATSWTMMNICKGVCSR